MLRRRQVHRACATRLALPRERRTEPHIRDICTGTGLTPSASAPGMGLPLPHLRRDWAHPCRICAGTGLTPAAPAPGPSVPVFTAVPASRCFPVLLVPPTVSRSLLQMVACAYASDVISLISILYHSRRAYRQNGVIQMNPKVIRHGYADCALHSECQQPLHWCTVR